MLIALLALIGVDLITLVVLLAFVVSRKRWIKRQRGAFPGAVRVVGGKVDGLKPKWRRGYGRWPGEEEAWAGRPVVAASFEAVIGRDRVRRARAVPGGTARAAAH